MTKLDKALIKARNAGMHLVEFSKDNKFVLKNDWFKLVWNAKQLIAFNWDTGNFTKS